MSFEEDVEVVTAVLRRYSIERVPEAAITPVMAIDALARIVEEVREAERRIEALEDDVRYPDG